MSETPERLAQRDRDEIAERHAEGPWPPYRGRVPLTSTDQLEAEQRGKPIPYEPVRVGPDNGLRAAAQNIRAHIEGGMEDGTHLPGDLCFRQLVTALEGSAE